MATMKIDMGTYVVSLSLDDIERVEHRHDSLMLLNRTSKKTTVFQFPKGSKPCHSVTNCDSTRNTHSGDKLKDHKGKGPSPVKEKTSKKPADSQNSWKFKTTRNGIVNPNLVSPVTRDNTKPTPNHKEAGRKDAKSITSTRKKAHFEKKVSPQDDRLNFISESDSPKNNSIQEFESPENNLPKDLNRSQATLADPKEVEPNNGKNIDKTLKSHDPQRSGARPYTTSPGIDIGVTPNRDFPNTKGKVTPIVQEAQNMKKKEYGVKLQSTAYPNRGGQSPFESQDLRYQTKKERETSKLPEDRMNPQQQEDTVQWGELMRNCMKSLDDLREKTLKGHTDLEGRVFSLSLQLETLKKKSTIEGGPNLQEENINLKKMKIQLEKFEERMNEHILETNRLKELKMSSCDEYSNMSQKVCELNLQMETLTKKYSELEEVNKQRLDNSMSTEASESDFKPQEEPLNLKKLRKQLEKNDEKVNRISSEMNEKINKITKEGEKNKKLYDEMTSRLDNLKTVASYLYWGHHRLHSQLQVNTAFEENLQAEVKLVKDSTAVLLPQFDYCYGQIKEGLKYEWKDTNKLVKQSVKDLQRIKSTVPSDSTVREALGALRIE